MTICVLLFNMIIPGSAPAGLHGVKNGLKHGAKHDVTNGVKNGVKNDLIPERGPQTVFF